MRYGEAEQQSMAADCAANDRANLRNGALDGALGCGRAQPA